MFWVKFIGVRATGVILKYYCVFDVEFIVIRARVDIAQWYRVLCVVFCGFSNSTY